MSNPYRAMCAELTERLEWFIAEDETNENDPGNQYWLTGKQAGIDSVTRARALLAQPVAVGPTDEELEKLVFDNYSIAISFACDSKEEAQVMISSYVKFARAVLAKWGRPAPQPVAVSERLPGPEDCDEQGRCWLWERDCGYSGCKWALVDRTWSLSQSDEDLSVYTHWLPANALPHPRG